MCSSDLVRLAYTMPDAATANALVDTSRLKTGVDLPRSVEGLHPRAYGEQVIFDVWWTKPRSPNQAALIHDINMNTPDVLSRLSTQPETTPLIASQRAWGDDTHGKVALAFNVVGRFSKPFDAQTVNTLAVGLAPLVQKAPNADKLSLPTFVEAITVRVEEGSIIVEATW